MSTCECESEDEELSCQADDRGRTGGDHGERESRCVCFLAINVTYVVCVDSQSWFHSQEANVMLDSAQICAEWAEAIKGQYLIFIHGFVHCEVYPPYAI